MNTKAKNKRILFILLSLLSVIAIALLGAESIYII